MSAPVLIRKYSARVSKTDFLSHTPVVHVVGMRTPFKIVNTIVILVLVDMVYFIAAIERQ